MKILNTSQQSPQKIIQEVAANRSRSSQVGDIVAPILSRVRQEGDTALFELTEKFDGMRLTNLRVSREEIKQSYKNLSKEQIFALKKARRNIERFHKTTLRRKEPQVETQPGVCVWREFRPIEKVGLYIPGGKAAYPSTVLMLGVPARLAGCSQIVMCTPADKKGNCPAASLVAADLCGITEIYKAGGAQAIGALAYGTESVPAVSKIFGPGNQYVTTAKMLVYGQGQVDIDMPAGPSEIMVIADESAPAEWIAADLMSQLEHGTDSQAVLITFSEKYAAEVITELRRQMMSMPRCEIIAESFAKSFAIVASSLQEAAFIANEYAPEHFEIIGPFEQKLLSQINNVGSVFLGKYSCESIGDYAAGANHTLPTSGYAKMFSPVSVDSFGKMIQVQKISRQGFNAISKTVETLAALEGLDAHGNSVRIRLNSSFL